MSNVNPIPKDPMVNAASAGSVWGVAPSKLSAAEKTASKVSKLELPKISKAVGLAGREISPLKDATALYKKIKSDWDFLEPQVLAEKIVELERKVDSLELGAPLDPKVQDLKEKVERVLFEFVNPGVTELNVRPKRKMMPASFVANVSEVGKEVIKRNSIEPFLKNFNERQQWEVMRFAKARGA